MMLLSVDFDAFLIRALSAMEPYLDTVVCGGGVANALYRHHEWASSVRWRYLGTEDFDVVVPQSIPLGQRPPLADLMHQADFEEKEYRNDKYQSVAKLTDAMMR
ncbi:MAG: hypothetical protein AAF492_00045 [Verrucomicrobiota bacterium]